MAESTSEIHQVEITPGSCRSKYPNYTQNSRLNALAKGSMIASQLIWNRLR